MGGELWN